MPSHFGPDPGDSDSDIEKPSKDEYGDVFEDYGFLKRAEEYKASGNSDFKKERYEKALKEYDNALDQLLTVAYDKSIILGKKKWNDIVVLRSLIHLNKSTCFFKLQKWQGASDEALECLVGNVREEMMHTDPHVRAKVKRADRKNGYTSATFVEQRLPRAMRAKAWFRMSQCYAHLDYLDRARESMAKALEMCDDQQLLAEISRHSVRIDALEKQQRERQRKQFKGFWDKLQDRGGYAQKRPESKQHWDSLNYTEKFKHVEEADRAGDPSAPPWTQLHPAQEGLDGRFGAFPVRIEDAMQDSGRHPYRITDHAFAQHLPERGQQGNVAAGADLAPSREGAPASSQDARSPPPESTPPRPRVEEEAPIRWRTEADGAPRLPKPGASSTAEAWARRGAGTAEQRGAGPERQAAAGDDGACLARLEALDDSSGDEEGAE